MDNKSLKKLEADLWESADLLRADSKLTSNQYCMPVLGLLFLRYAYGRFKKVEAELLKNRPSRGGRVLPIEASDFVSKSALFLPKEAQFDYLVNLPANIASAKLKNVHGQPLNSLGEVVNNAMELVEAQSEKLKGVLPKTYTDFKDNLLAELLRTFNNNALDDVGGDVMGRIYEYFLSKFAKNIASDDGVFFTPKSLVKMIVNVLEPSYGVLLDPACGSGGMFVQTGDFVNAAGMASNETMTFYGQEKVEYNAQLCLMNMAVHGLTGVVKSGDEANSFYHDAHNLTGLCDYVMANPPFNVDKVKAESCQSAGRLPFGLPAVNKDKEIGNGNYLWISYFYSYLNEKGRAGFVMAASATDSQSKDKDIRVKLVATGHVDCMISVGNNFFYTKSLPCTLWFVVDRTLNEWSEWQLKNLNAIVWLYRGELDKYQSLLAEYRTTLLSYADETDDANLEKILRKTSKIAKQVELLKEYRETLRAEAKASIDAADKKSKKKTQEEWDTRLAEFDEILNVAKEADWLYEKFGDGKYKDILGLCKIATRAEIAEKNFSLTPGAYVGVAPVEDDGVDFAERMHEIHEELLKLQDESNTLMKTISKNMRELGI